MKLTQREVKILSLMNEVPVENFMERTKRYTSHTKKEIERIIKKLLKEKYVEIIAIPHGDKEVDWYFPTGKGESTPLDDNLRWLKDFGGVWTRKK